MDFASPALLGCKPWPQWAITDNYLVLKFVVGIPDDVAGHVLSFWPPAARHIEARRPGTGQFPYRPKRDEHFQNFWSGSTCPICGQRVCPDGYPGCVGGRPLFKTRTKLFYHSISASGVYSGKSFEELRLEDYELGRDAGRWWPGGMLQVNKARSTALDLDLATVLDSFHFP